MTDKMASVAVSGTALIDLTAIALLVPAGTPGVPGPPGPTGISPSAAQVAAALAGTASFVAAVAAAMSGPVVTPPPPPPPPPLTFTAAFTNETGTASGGTTTALDDTTKQWKVDEWKNAAVGIFLAGGFAGSTVAGNTATRLNLTSALPTGPAPGNVYSMGNYQTQSPYAWHRFANYSVALDDWGQSSGTLTLAANSKDDWTATLTGHGSDDQNANIGCYPSITRGWSSADISLQGTHVTDVGMGIQVAALTKCNVYTAFKTPQTLGASRWDVLEDVYFHKSATPSGASAWPPQVDLQVFLTMMDNAADFFAQSAALQNPSFKTFAGTRYMVIVDPPGGAGFHQPDGHIVQVYVPPFGGASGGAHLWGQGTATVPLAAIIAWLSKPNPTDDAGAVIKNAQGQSVNYTCIDPTWYLTAVNAGPEISWVTAGNNTFQCTGFNVAMQNEPDAL